MKKVLVTGGKGRFALELKKIKNRNKFIFLEKSELNILKKNSIARAINKYKPDILLHLAGLSRPMDIHNKKIIESINLNIIGTSNVVIECIKKNIKLIYFSTSYLYPGRKGNYKETDGLLPWNNYGWSKLGGESAVQMYKNSLILRVCMTEKPFIHSHAYANVQSNFIFQEDLAKKFIKIINKKGIYNLGGKSQTIYEFVFKTNKHIKKKFSKGEFPFNQSMSLKKLNKIIKKNKS